LDNTYKFVFDFRYFFEFQNVFHAQPNSVPEKILSPKNATFLPQNFLLKDSVRNAHA